MDYRRQQIRRYFLTLAIAVVAYLIYALTAASWIEGPRRVPGSSLAQSEFDLGRFKVDLVAWLPEDAWERQPCKQISTRTGNIFFQEYTAHDDGRVEVRPLTIMLAQAGAAAGQPPIVLRAPEGAILQLDRPLSVGGAAVQLEGGQLLGPITLYRPATSPEAHDEWVIETSQIQISKQKIQTIQSVDFRFGPHQGSGRNLILEFEADPLRAQQTAMTGIRGIRRIELVQIDRLHLAPSGMPSEAGQTNGFDVTCQGPFEFDLSASVATLNDNVKIVSVDQPEDWLTADQIALRLGSDDENDAESAGLKTSGKWALQSIEAIGQPAELHSQARQVSLRGERLKYSLAQRTVEVLGRRGVELRQAQLELTAVDALYEITADGSLGQAQINGPGTLLRPAAPEQPSIDIHWDNQLTIGKDAGQKLISLSGNARISLDGNSNLNADQLQLWLWEIPIAADGAVDGGGASSPTTSTAGSSPKWSWQPDRMTARGRVRFESLKLTGDFGELTAQWPRPDIFKVAEAAAVRPTPPRHGLASTEPTQQPQNSVTGLPPIQPPAEPAPKVIVSGSAATIQMQDPASRQFREIVIDGKVRVRQPAEGGGSAFDITGEHLQIIPQDKERFRLAISGSAEAPSRVQARQMELNAHTVQLDQSLNRLWIEGGGKMRAEQVFSAKAASVADPKAPADPSLAPAAHPNAGPTTIDVEWSGGMVFDGQQIYLEAGVFATCEQLNETGPSHVEARCDAIQLTLTSAVDFSGVTTNQQAVDPQVDVLTMIGQVAESKRVFKSTAAPDNQRRAVELLRQTSGLDGNLVSVQRMSVPWGQINAINGKLDLRGPGDVSLWFMESTSGPWQAPSAAATDPPQLTSTNVLFDTSLTGNIQDSELLFSGKVRALHGPVSDWQQTLDANQAPPRGDFYRLRSDQLQITQWKRSSAEAAHVEVIALGQAQLDGETFEALAERIGYNQSQEKVILEGDPRNGAQVTYQTTPDGPRNPLVASKISFNLRDNTTQVEGFQHGVLTTGPILRRR